MSKYVNPLYGEHENIKSRRMWLKNKITEMGHHPRKYEEWHRQLDALGEEPPEQIVETTNRPQTIHTVVGRSGGRLKAYADFSKLTDAELNRILTHINKEIKSRHTARYKEAKDKQQALIDPLLEKGWLYKNEAFKEVRRIIYEQGLYEANRHKKQLDDKTMQKMVDGDHCPWDEVGPMTTGIYKYGKPLDNKKTKAIYDPKQLLCHVINHCKAREERRNQQRLAEEARKAKLAEWEELQKARSAEVAQAWFAKMEEKNGRWKKALAELEAKKAAAITDAVKNTGSEQPDDIAVPIQEAAPSPADGEQSDSY